MTTRDTAALVRQMKEALAARRAFDTEPACAINRKLFGDMDEAIAAADQWLANPPNFPDHLGKVEVSMPKLCAACARELSLSLRQQQPMAPDGWKLVPVEPTQEMVEIGAGVVDDNGGNARWSDIREAWAGMLAAALQPGATK